MYQAEAGLYIADFTRKQDAVDWLASEILHVYPVTSMTTLKRLAKSIIDLDETVQINGVTFKGKTLKKDK